MLEQTRHAVRGLPRSVEGLEHIPAHGPLVVLAGGDGRRPLDAVLSAVRGRPARRLDGPRALHALAYDEAVVVRGVADAVATAERASAPVLPVVLWQDGHHTRVVAGPPLPRHPPEPPAGPRAEHPAERLARDLAMDPAERLARDLAPDPAESAARDRVEAGHEALARLVERARKPAWPAGPRSARAAARHLDRVFEALLSRTDPLPDHVLYEQAALLIALGRLGDRHNLDLRVGRLRLTALRHENHPLPVKAAALWRLRAGTEEALRRDPDHLMANYLLGRWHLSAPRLLGGRRDTAVVHLERAERLGRGDTRYVLGHAEALLAADRPADALSALERVIEAPADQPRTQRRRQSAIRMSRALRHGHAPGRPARPAGPRARVKG